MEERKTIVFDEEVHRQLSMLKAKKGFITFNQTMEWMIRELKEWK